MCGGDHLERPAPAVTRRTSHVLVPCRADAATFVSQLLARDLASWRVDEGITDGLLLAAAEAVLNAVAARGARATHPCMLIVAWTLSVDAPDRQHWFRFFLVEREAAGSSRAAAMRAHPSAMREHPALAQRRCVMDAVMDSVVVSDGAAGTRIVLEKTFPGTATA
jgi:hypothetical protein